MTEQEFLTGLKGFAECFKTFSPTQDQKRVWWRLLANRNLERDVYYEAVRLACECTEQWFDNMNFTALILKQVENARGSIYKRQNEEMKQKVLPLPEEERVKNNRQGLAVMKKGLQKMGFNFDDLVKKL